MWFEANNIGYNNQENHLRAFRGDDICWVLLPPDNQIYYISNDGQIINPEIAGNPDGGFGANIVSNTYTNGLGVITFDGPVTKIGRMAFINDSSTGNWIKDIFIPSSVQSINQEAYSSTALSFVHFTENVNDINPSSLDVVNLDYVSVDPSNSTYLVKNKSVVDGAGVLVIGTNNSYYSSDITEIGWAAFSGRRYLTSMTIPSGQTRIGNFTFYKCTRLNNIIIPSSVQSIGREAFLMCLAFTSITIPSSVTSIENYAFDNCSNLTEIRVNATVPPTLGTEVFGYPGSVTGRQIKVPANKVNTYKTAAGWSDYASEIVSQ